LPPRRGLIGRVTGWHRRARESNPPRPVWPQGALYQTRQHCWSYCLAISPLHYYTVAVGRASHPTSAPPEFHGTCTRPHQVESHPL